MLVRDKKHFTAGALMALAFFGLFMVIMSPVFGNGMNGLEFSDDVFNKLSKGSSYFVPKITKQNEAFLGKMFEAKVKFDKPEDAKTAADMVTIAGGQAELNGGEVKVSGDLGKLLSVVIRDGDLMYKNEGAKVKETYGYDEKKVTKNWWTLLSKIDKQLQNAKEFDKATMIASVNKSIVEPGYNYYGIPAQKVSDHILLMTALLVFYVVYTMWWGFSLYHLFEGLGLTVHKVAVKKEV
ncbi:MAG TPA: hypothetical protein VK445_07655 [Dissulfurispiraceae bacterium]|nr:hypothetical protein [Dissulfurispiraceae bacterium]